MELINATRMVAGYTMGMDPSGRELLVVVIKGTFHLPKNGEELRLKTAQLPLVMADTFTGVPGLSAPYYEMDFAPRKHYCDVLLQGRAYAPGARPTARVPVGIRVGNWTKTFAVVGDRHWQAGLSGISASAPEPFLTKPINYDLAFGGTDVRHEDPARHAAYMKNPVGRGFHRHLRSDWLDGSPLPNTEELNRPVSTPDGSYVPMAFGPVGRGWEPRLRHAGTYDQAWLDHHFPFLPPDFDEQYYQAAPLDQQLRSPVIGQEVSLINLTPDGCRAFKLPAFVAPVYCFPKNGGREDLNAALDTLVLEPEQELISMTWRATRPLKRDIFEIGQILVGKKGQEWWQRREELAFPVPVVVAKPQLVAKE